jgi:SAM-dependent methyltransferase
MDVDGTRIEMSGLNGSSHNSLGYSLRRFFIDDFYSRHVTRLQVGSQVLDLGGHKIRKRGAFDIERYCLRVTYANLFLNKGADVQCDASWLPCKEGCFDAVVCSELLEHVYDSVSVLREIYRVLRPKGVCLISVPFLFQVHADPHDYCRYTDHYWRSQLERLGFAEINIEKQGLFWSVMVDMLRALANERVRQGGLRRLWLQRLVASLIATGKRMALNRERRIGEPDHAFLSRYTTGYGIRAVRP